MQAIIRINRLIEFMLCYLTNSAGPERAFSTMNWIKDKRRSKMKDTTLNNIMHLRHNKLEVDELNFFQAFKDLNIPLERTL